MTAQGFNFTDGVRKVLADAREEAFRLGHEYCAPEHMLLGMTLGKNDGSEIITRCGESTLALRDRIEAVIQRGKGTPTSDLPYTSRAKKSLEFAMTEARDLGASTVTSGMLLLGLLHEGKNIAAQLLDDSGVTLERSRTIYQAMTTEGSVEVER